MGRVPLDISMEIDDNSALIALVEKGIAVSILPEAMYSPSKLLKTTRIVRPHLRISFGLLYPKDLTLNAKAFKEIAQHSISNYRLAFHDP
jgi:DNA-binding transcriptional LysR family regulator